MAKKRKFGESYQFHVDEEVAEIYAKESCRHCLGKGVIKSQRAPGGTIRKGCAMVETATYCICVRRNQEKYG